MRSLGYKNIFPLYELENVSDLWTEWIGFLAFRVGLSLPVTGTETDFKTVQQRTWKKRT